jgi:hypothetical protein
MEKDTVGSSDNEKEPKADDDNEVDEDSNKKIGIDRYKTSSDDSSYDSDDYDDDEDGDNGDDDDFQALFDGEDASKEEINDNEVDEDSNKKVGIDRYRTSSDDSSYNPDDNDNDDEDDDNGDYNDFQALFDDEDASKGEIDDDGNNGREEGNEPEQAAARKKRQEWFPRISRLEDGSVSDEFKYFCVSLNSCNLSSEEEVEIALWELASLEWDAKSKVNKNLRFLKKDIYTPARQDGLRSMARQCTYFDTTPCK